eukprot:s573_g25.t1
MRTTGTPVGEDVRWTIRDTVRAIKRGLGPAQLKDSFDLELLQPIVPYTRQRTEFHVGQLDAKIDMTLIAAWWMLREIEVNFLVPISKADTQGKRLHLPGALGAAVPLATRMPQAVREARLRGGTASFVGGDAQVAISPPATSTSALPTVLRPLPLLTLLLRLSARPALTASRTRTPQNSGKVTAAQVQDELHRSMKAVLSLKEMFVVQTRRKVAHEIGVPEDTNDIAVWRATCGWAYGWSHFYRVEKGSLGPEIRQCKLLQALLPGTDG